LKRVSRSQPGVFLKLKRQLKIKEAKAAKRPQGRMPEWIEKHRTEARDTQEIYLGFLSSLQLKDQHGCEVTTTWSQDWGRRQRTTQKEPLELTQLMVVSVVPPTLPPPLWKT
jgi:hypothetical protein